MYILSTQQETFHNPEKHAFSELSTFQIKFTKKLASTVQLLINSYVSLPPVSKKKEGVDYFSCHSEALDSCSLPQVNPAAVSDSR